MKKITTQLLVFLLLFISFPLLRAAEPDTVLIDFGNDLSPAPWNNVTNARTDTLADLLTSNGLNSGISLVVSDSFNNINTTGTNMPDPSLDLPSTATGDSFFGNVGTFGGQQQPTGGVTLSGLNTATAYHFSIFASRTGVNDNRETQYTVTGSTVAIVTLDAANNTSLIAEVTGMLPAANGTITILAEPGPNNTNGTGFYYLGAIRMDYVPMQNNDINIDFGNSTTAGAWNNISDQNTGTVADLITSTGLNSGIAVAITDDFNGINNSGTTTPDPALNLPSTASDDSFFGNTATFGGQIQPTAELQFSNLDTATAYSFTIFASRMGVSDNRETQYTVSGKTTVVVTLDVANNDSLAAVVNAILPNMNGTISILAEPGPNNTNGSGFYYLGALRMSYTSEVQEPQPESLTLIAPSGGEIWEVGKDATIRWESANVISLAIEYSTDNGQTWTGVDTVAGFDQQYTWTIPNDTSSLSLVKVSGLQVTDQSENTFSIVEDNGLDCHIVVLGSSTAAGTGPSSSDSAWVNRYRNYLTNRNTDFVVTNLAQGGFVTYNILPTGTTIPTGVNQTINTARNITQALSLDPDAIIINLPSNDAANSYPVADQLANYDLILAAANADTVPVWVATPQPREFSGNAARIQIQLDMIDSTYARFGDFAIDFWTGLGDSTSAPDPAYDSGDGVHLNDAGHKILFDRVIGAGVDAYLFDAKQNTSSIEDARKLFGDFRVAPNPMSQKAIIQFLLQEPMEIEIVLFDIQGRRVQSIENGRLLPGNQEIAFDSKGLPSGLYFCRIEGQKNGKKTSLTTKILIRK